MKRTLAIADISGYTRFVNSIEIKHAAIITQELLQTIVDTLGTKFQLEEIEGDAVFVSAADNIGFEHLQTQLEQTFEQFHLKRHHITAHNLCNCGACANTVDLGLKFVVHRGEVSTTNTAGKEKPFGQSVIEVHRLLKNQVPLNEYLLCTNQIIPSTPEETLNEFSDEVQESHDGKILVYRYRDLTDCIPSAPDYVEEWSDSDYVVSHSVTINRHWVDVYHAALDLEFRKSWSPGVSAIEHNSAELPSVGSVHTCVINGKDFEFVNTGKTMNTTSASFVEQGTKNFLFTKAGRKFHVEALGNQATFTQEFHFDLRPFLRPFLTPILKKRFLQNFADSSALFKKMLETGSLGN